MAATKAPPPLISHDLEELIGLVRDADSVELKLTVPDGGQALNHGDARIDPLAARLRQIWFFDTPDLTLDSAGVVVRARRNQNAPDDTVVKLRPVIPAELPARLRAREGSWSRSTRCREATCARDRSRAGRRSRSGTP